MSELRDDEVIDPNALRPRELIVKIYEKVERLEKQNDLRAKSDLDTQLKLKELEVEMKNQISSKSTRNATVWGIVSGAISAIITAIATKFFT